MSLSSFSSIHPLDTPASRTRCAQEFTMARSCSPMKALLEHRLVQIHLDVLIEFLYRLFAKSNKLCDWIKLERLPSMNERGVLYHRSYRAWYNATLSMAVVFALHFGGSVVPLRIPLRVSYSPPCPIVPHTQTRTSSTSLCLLAD